MEAVGYSGVVYEDVRYAMSSILSTPHSLVEKGKLYTFKEEEL